jgi:hypothetical protein
MSRNVPLAAMTLAAACGSSSAEAPGGDVVCGVLADRVDVRLAQHRAELEGMSLPEGRGDVNGRESGLNTTLREVADSTIIVRELALGCLRSEAKECGVMSPDAVAANPAGALQQLEALSEGLRGRGHCASPRASLRRRSVDDLCRVAYQLAAEQVTEEQWDAIGAAWQQPRDQLGRAHPGAALATHVLSRWRVEIDYGLALAPACGPPWVAASCEHLRRGLGEATPEDLRARLDALSAAYGGTPCPAPR